MLGSNVNVAILKCHFIHTTSWTSLYMDGTAVNYSLADLPNEAGPWDPNYTSGVDFLDHDFL